jgi:hypothetical protein
VCGEERGEGMKKKKNKSIKKGGAIRIGVSMYVYM